MKKVTTQQFNSIIASLQSEINRYAKVVLLCVNKKTSNVILVDALNFEDMVYLTNALAQFAKSKDVQELYNALLMQDTDVREQFLATLRMLEDTELVSAF